MTLRTTFFLLIIVTLCLLFLKLNGALCISWWLVFLPLYLPLLVVAFFYFLYVSTWDDNHEQEW